MSVRQLRGSCCSGPARQVKADHRRVRQQQRSALAAWQLQQARHARRAAASWRAQSHPLHPCTQPRSTLHRRSALASQLTALGLGLVGDPAVVPIKAGLVGLGLRGGCLPAWGGARARCKRQPECSTARRQPPPVQTAACCLETDSVRLRATDSWVYTRYTLPCPALPPLSTRPAGQSGGTAAQPARTPRTACSRAGAGACRAVRAAGARRGCCCCACCPCHAPRRRRRAAGRCCWCGSKQRRRRRRLWAFRRRHCWDRGGRRGGAGRRRAAGGALAAAAAHGGGGGRRRCGSSRQGAGRGDALTGGGRRRGEAEAARSGAAEGAQAARTAAGVAEGLQGCAPVVTCPASLAPCPCPPAPLLLQDGLPGSVAVSVSA